MASPIQFFRSVRAEARKVSWPGRKESVNFTLIVILMMLLVAVFFLGVDQIFGWFVQTLLTVGK